MEYGARSISYPVLNIFLVCNHVTRRPWLLSVQQNFSRRIYMRKEFSSQRRKTLFVLDRQHGRRGVTCKLAILCSYFSAAGMKPVTGFIKSFTNVFSWTNPAASFLIFLVSISQQHYSKTLKMRAELFKAGLR